MIRWNGDFAVARITDQEREYRRGAAFAVVTMLKLGASPRMVAEAMAWLKLTPCKARVAGVDDETMRFLGEAWSALPGKRNGQEGIVRSQDGRPLDPR